MYPTNKSVFPVDLVILHNELWIVATDLLDFCVEFVDKFGAMGSFLEEVHGVYCQFTKESAVSEVLDASKELQQCAKGVDSI